MKRVRDRDPTEDGEPLRKRRRRSRSPSPASPQVVAPPAPDVDVFVNHGSLLDAFGARVFPSGTVSGDRAITPQAPTPDPEKQYLEYPMSGIVVKPQPTEEDLAVLGIRSWGTWDCEESEFPWTYDQMEVCYFLSGDVEIVPEGSSSDPIRIGKGNLVMFPKGLSCTWKVKKAVNKHFKFFN